MIKLEKCSKSKIQYYSILHWSKIPVNKYTLLSYFQNNLQINKIQAIKKIYTTLHIDYIYLYISTNF